MILNGEDDADKDESSEDLSKEDLCKKVSSRAFNTWFLQLIIDTRAQKGNSWEDSFFIGEVNGPVGHEGGENTKNCAEDLSCPDHTGKHKVF